MPVFSPRPFANDHGLHADPVRVFLESADGLLDVDDSDEDAFDIDDLLAQDGLRPAGLDDDFAVPGWN